MAKGTHLDSVAHAGGEDAVRGIAKWLKHRVEDLGQAMGLARAGMPHRTTIGRVLRKVVIVEQSEETVGDHRGRSQLGRPSTCCLRAGRRGGSLPKGGGEQAERDSGGTSGA